MTATGSLMVTRYGVETLASAEMVPEIAHALANRVEVGISLAREDAKSLFVLRPFGCAVQVVNATGAHLGTYADVGRAIECAWASPWWEE